VSVMRCWSIVTGMVTKSGSNFSESTCMRTSSAASARDCLVDAYRIARGMRAAPKRCAPLPLRATVANLRRMIGHATTLTERHRTRLGRSGLRLLEHLTPCLNGPSRGFQRSAAMARAYLALAGFFDSLRLQAKPNAPAGPMSTQIGVAPVACRSRFLCHPTAWLHRFLASPAMPLKPVETKAQCILN
jgi:hypothetical protein